MYYRTVNRGVFFTKPGKYAIGLVIVLGLIATSSGYNGFYLSLGLGLGLLIVSGLLSEKIMKACEVEKFLDVSAEAQKPFTLSYPVKNQSRTFTLYGVEVIYPAARKKKKLPAPVKATLLTLGTGQETVVSAICPGMPRGCYDTLQVRVQTVYPFGWLEKFKFATLQGEAVILPAFDKKVADQIRNQMGKHRSGGDEEREFFTHRPFQGQGLRDIDWKKSAGRDSALWVRKVYRGESTQRIVLIRGHADERRPQDGEPAFEAWLSRLRTAVDTLHQLGFEIILELEDKYVAGWQPSLRALAACGPCSSEKLSITSNVGANALAAVVAQGLTLDVFPQGEWIRVQTSKTEAA